ncbi:hypothetical protein [Allosphingosinicella humi]
MNFKGLMAVTAAVALAATPAIAANNAAPTPAVEYVDGSQQADAGTWVIVGLGVVAAGLGIWALADGGDNGVEAPAPVSP